MFDIGFAELLLIATVSLLVIGPERLPGTVRTVMAWVHRLRRGFNEIRQEVEQELHNDAVLQDLKKTGSQIREQAREASREVEQQVERELETVSRETGLDPGDKTSEASRRKSRGNAPEDADTPATASPGQDKTQS